MPSLTTVAGLVTFNLVAYLEAIAIASFLVLPVKASPFLPAFLASSPNPTIKGAMSGNSLDAKPAKSSSTSGVFLDLTNLTAWAIYVSLRFLRLAVSFVFCFLV